MPDSQDKYLKIYPTPYGNVHVNVGAPFIPVNLSCGFDSAVMLYMVAETANKLNREAKIQPITVRRTNPEPKHLPELDRVDNFPIADRIIAFVKAHFFNVKIQPSLRQDAPFWWVRNDQHQSSYVYAQRNLQQYYSWLTNFDFPEGHPTLPFVRIAYNGVTKNPPIELEGHHHRELHRDTTIETNTGDDESVSVYVENPKQLTIETFRNADKRITMWLANELGILQSMLKITRSCEGDRESTNEWTEECGECWWCLEREWALKNFDKPEMKFNEE